MTIDSPQELNRMRRIGVIVANTIQEMGAKIRPGISTLELDRIGERYLSTHGALSAPRTVYDFPGATCISVNCEVAHGIPSGRVLRDGDVVNIDVSASLDGYYSDSGVSFPVGKASDEVLALCEAGRAACRAGVNAVKTKQRFSRVGRAMEREANKRGYKVIRDLTGHGVGRSLHEEPKNVRSYYDPLDTRRIGEGMVFTLEPMLSRTAEASRQLADGWTLETVDRSRVVQFEHTMVATRRGALVLTKPGPIPDLE